MPQYMIEIPHSPEECSAAASEIPRHPRAPDMTVTMYWGCRDGVHTTWIVGEFETDAEARRLIPVLLRDTARAVRVHPRARDAAPARPRKVRGAPSEA